MHKVNLYPLKTFRPALSKLLYSCCIYFLEVFNNWSFWKKLPCFPSSHIFACLKHSLSLEFKKWKIMGRVWGFRISYLTSIALINLSYIYKMLPSTLVWYDNFSLFYLEPYITLPEKQIKPMLFLNYDLTWQMHRLIIWDESWGSYRGNLAS